MAGSENQHCANCIGTLSCRNHVRGIDTVSAFNGDTSPFILALP